MKYGVISSNGLRIRRRDKRIWFVMLGAFVGVFLFSFLVQRFKNDGEVGAASLAGFDPGYIISDYQMGNYNSMSEAEIQSFLTAKNPCSNRDYGLYLSLSANKNYTWHFENGHFVCLSEERFGDNDNEIGFQYGESAAHIIWQTAQDYRINPQVLLVLLQKETSLITDPIPNNGDYRKATGYGCPDTAACSSKYYGFKNQVRNAAALFRAVLDGGWTNYPLGNNYVQYNPNAACGGSVVNIRSLATSALYRYTPYQPNVGALAAGYGMASCGAYGNRNFYLYFEDWFGGITKQVENIETVTEAQTKYEKPVEDGVYMLVSKAFPDKVIDAKGGVSEDVKSALLQVYQKKDVDFANQLYMIKYDDKNGYYGIINPLTGLALDVKGAGVSDGTHVQIFEAHGNCNQDWLFEQDDEGYYSIISRCSSKALDASLSSMFVNIFKKHGGDNQKWSLIKIDDAIDSWNWSYNKIRGSYQIVSKAFPDKAIDVKGGVHAGMNSGLLQVYAKKEDNADNQIFDIEYDELRGAYRIVNPSAGLFVDVKGANAMDGTATQIFKENGNCNQDWNIEKDEEGYYMIESKCSGKVLDASLSSMFVNIFKKHGGNNQKWELVAR